MRLVELHKSSNDGFEIAKSLTIHITRELYLSFLTDPNLKPNIPRRLQPHRTAKALMEAVA